MSLSPILFLGVFCCGIGAAVFISSEYAAYTYLLVFHMSPYGTWWESSVPALRYLAIAGAVVVMASLTVKTRTGRDGWFSFRLAWWLTAFIVWLWVQLLWAKSSLSLEGAILYTKHVVIAAALYLLCKGRIPVVRNALLAIVLGGAWLGWLGQGRGGRVEGIAGAISDANTLGAHASACLLIASMLLFVANRPSRAAAFLCIPFLLNNVILSGSRGALLGLLAGGGAAFLLCPKTLKPKFISLGALGFLLFLGLAHDRFIERMVETYEAFVGGQQEKMDGSASGRFVIAEAGLRMAFDYPEGVGYKGHAMLSPFYLDRRFLTSGAAVGMEAGRSAHNSLIAVLVEFGFAGLFLFSGALLVAVAGVIRTGRSQMLPIELRVLNAGIGGVLGCVFIAGMFHNYSALEVMYWAMGLSCAVNAAELPHAKK